MNLCNDRAWIETLFYTCWLLWKNRNQAQFDLMCRTPMSLFKSIKSQTQDLKKAVCQSATLSPAPISTCVAPPSGLLKVNVDASWNVHDNVAVVAVVIRDHSGATVCCASWRYACCSAVLLAELLAIRFGLDLTLQQRLHKILLESDSLMAINELKKGLDSYCE